MSTIALLQRHQRLEKEMGAYASEVKRLGEQAQSAAQLAPLTVRNNHQNVCNFYENTTNIFTIMGSMMHFKFTKEGEAGAQF